MRGTAGVERTPTLVITQEHHYYPFGMNMSGIERDGELKYQFNGMIEKEEAFGLELYETPFRSYDAQLGRFWQVEPLADIYCGISMYQFAYNNPVSFNDPTGLNPSGPGGGKKKKDDRECPHCGRIDGKHNPHNNSGGGKIGAGGYTWELGNNRASPYSMGGTPGQGPAIITIVNYGCDDDVTAAIETAQGSLDRMGVNAKIIEVSSGEAIGLAQATGLNATYLFGESTIWNDDAQGPVAGKDYGAMYNLAKRLEGNRSIDKSSMSTKIYDMKTNSDGIEFTSGWVYNGTSMVSDIGGTQVNVGFVNTHYAQAMMNKYLESNSEITRQHFLAIHILHMMGHSAGLNHIDYISRGSFDDLDYNLMNGKGGDPLNHRLMTHLKKSKTYETAVHGNSSVGHTIWRMFVQSYFSSTWNGNTNNGFRIGNFPGSNIGILPFAIKNGYIAQ